METKLIGVQDATAVKNKGIYVIQMKKNGDFHFNTTKYEVHSHFFLYDHVLISCELELSEASSTDVSETRESLRISLSLSISISLSLSLSD